MSHPFSIQTPIGLLNLIVEDADRVRGYLPEAYTIHRTVYAVQVDFVHSYGDWIMRDETRRVDLKEQHGWTPHDPIMWQGRPACLIDSRTTEKAQKVLKENLLPPFKTWIAERATDYRSGLRDVYHKTIQVRVEDVQAMNKEVSKVWDFLHLVGEKVDQGEELTPQELRRWKNLSKLYKNLREWQKMMDV